MAGKRFARDKEGSEPESDGGRQWGGGGSVRIHKEKKSI